MAATDDSWLVTHGLWLVAGGCYCLLACSCGCVLAGEGVVGWWSVAGDWWLLAGGGWLVVAACGPHTLCLQML